MKSKLRENKVIAVITVLLTLGLFLLGYYIWAYQGLRSSYENYYPAVEEHTLIELNEDTFVTQEFKSDQIHFRGFQYYLIKDPEAQGIFCAELSDQNGILANREIALSDMGNAEWSIDFFDMTLKKDHLYTVRFYTKECTDHNYPNIILMDKEDSCKENTNCYVNGEMVDSAVFLSYNFSKLESTYVNFSVFALALFCSIMIMGMIIKFYYPDKYNAFGRPEFKEQIKKTTVIALFIMQFILIVPNIVYRLAGLNLDPSWRYFLNIANDLGLKYGKDIYFTYGPLGYVCYLMNLDNSMTYWFGVFIWMVIFAIHIILLVWLYKLYKEHKVSFIAIVLSFLCYVTVFAESERDNYQLYLLILTVIIYFLGNKKSMIISNILLVLMFFCKFSTFTSGVAFITIFVVLQLLFNKDRQSIRLMLPSLIGAPILYLCYNPSFKGLFEYVTGILRISSGWMKTQQWDDSFSSRDYRCFFMIVLLYLSLIVIVMIVDYHKSSILIACSASLFFAYKYAVTAHGIEMGIWLTSLLFSTVMLTIDFDMLGKRLRERKRYLWLYGAAAVCCCSIAGLQAISLHGNFGELKTSLSNKAETLFSLNESSLMPELYTDTYIPADILKRIGDAAVTVYPWEVGYKAVYTNLNMVYSPSIQNCNEFIPWLDEKVAAYFYSEKAPEYIILEDETIYFHIKYLDNPLTWEAIKDEYHAVTTQEGFCLLEKRGTSMRREMELIKTEECFLSGSIACPDNADYVKIHLEYSLLGNIQEFFWRSGMTNMTIKYENGSENRGVIIVPNMQSGFSLDYLPLNIEDVSLVLNSDRGITKMSSLELSGIGLKVLEDKVRVEWYRYK